MLITGDYVRQKDTKGIKKKIYIYIYIYIYIERERERTGEKRKTEWREANKRKRCSLWYESLCWCFNSDRYRYLLFTSASRCFVCGSIICICLCQGNKEI